MLAHLDKGPCQLSLQTRPCSLGSDIFWTPGHCQRRSLCRPPGDGHTEILVWTSMGCPSWVPAQRRACTTQYLDLILSIFLHLKAVVYHGPAGKMWKFRTSFHCLRAWQMFLRQDSFFFFSGGRTVIYVNVNLRLGTFPDVVLMLIKTWEMSAGTSGRDKRQIL